MVNSWHTKLRNTLVLLIVAPLFLQSFIFAAEPPTFEDKAIGTTFKVLAKTFVATTDINQIKKDNIARVNKMSEERFNRKYARAYPTLESLPADLKADYGITEQMSKARALKTIRSLDKAKIYRMIDAIPDEFIALHFKHYLTGKKPALPKST